MVLLDAAILMNPNVWVASGHVGGFSDPLIDDQNTKERFRADKLIENKIEDMIKVQLDEDAEYKNLLNEKNKDENSTQKALLRIAYVRSEIISPLLRSEY